MCIFIHSSTSNLAIWFVFYKNSNQYRAYFLLARIWYDEKRRTFIFKMLLWNKQNIIFLPESFVSICSAHHTPRTAHMHKWRGKKKKRLKFHSMKLTKHWRNNWMVCGDSTTMRSAVNSLEMISNNSNAFAHTQYVRSHWHGIHTQQLAVAYCMVLSLTWQRRKKNEERISNEWMNERAKSTWKYAQCAQYWTSIPELYIHAYKHNQVQLQQC